MRIPDRVRRWRPDRLIAAAWGLAVLPVVVAAARAVADGWLPIGDNAIVAVRARDVLTANHPLLGTWSSASLEAGVDLNHPGPLLFDSVAPAARLFGGHAGPAIGAAVVNIVAITTVAAFARRAGGRLGALIALGAAGVLGFVMGSELLFDPWNPHIVILPCLALLTTAWGIAAGDRWALPVYVALGSYCLQVHLGYAYLVPLLLLVAFGAGWLCQRIATVRMWPSRRMLAVTAGVALVLWAQPLWEQFTGAGEGNLSRILGARGAAGPTLGASLALRFLAAVTTAAPWNLRDAFVDAVPTTSYASPGVLGPVDTVPLGWAVVRLVVLGVVLAAVGRSAWLHRDRATLAAIAVSVGALIVGAATLAITPVGPVGLTPHQMRWLWPMTAFTWTAVGLGAVRALQRRLPGIGDSRWRYAPLAPLAAVSLLALPKYTQDAGLAGLSWQQPIAGELIRQLDPLEGIGTVWFDDRGTPLYDNYGATVLAELQRLGVPFVVDNPGLVRQFGDRREFAGDNADVHMVMRWGTEALAPLEGYDRVAVVETPDPADAVAVFIGPVEPIASAPPP